MPKDTDLHSKLRALSDEAFALAQELARGAGDAGEQEQRAEAIDTLLDELLPQVEAAPEAQRHTLELIWNDARLDVGYVLSGGTLPTSTRMGRFLASLKASG